MSAVLSSSEIQVHPESYYEDCAKRAIAEAIEDCARRGIEDPKDIRFQIRRHYPLGIGGRKGPGYKAWNRFCHDAERDLGLEPKMHAGTKARLAELANESAKKPANRLAQPTTIAELVKQWPLPESYEDAVAFLRKHCICTITMKSDHDRVRVVLKNFDALDRTCKFEISHEVEAGDANGYEEAYLLSAQRAYKVWLEIESEKFGN